MTVEAIERTQYVFNQEKFFTESKYVPHAGQQQFHNSTARFRLMTCGRRWGKSLSASREAMKAMVIKPDQMGWIVAPSYELAEKVFREIYWGFNKYFPWLVKSSSLSKGSMMIELHNGSKVLGKSADNPVSLIGEGLDFLIIDEASKIKSDVWWEALRPTIADKKGWAVFISTPTGKNWFYELYILGIDKEHNHDYESWHFTSYDNPYLDKKEIDEARGKTPKDKFRQEWLAEFLESADSYFSYDLIKNCVDESIKIIEKREHPRHIYYLGVDCARMGEDESVIIVIERNIFNNEVKVVYIESWVTNTTVQLSGRVRFLDSQFVFQKVFVDMNGLGAGVYDELNVAIPGRLVGCKFTIKEKIDIYSNLKVLMENNRIKYPNNRKLIEQLRDLRYETMGNGDLKLHHSEYGFDDYPDALALACWGCSQNVSYAPTLR
ncbi:MAG: phage terminase large subunit [Candidatus Paceibacterota bacterium]